MQHLPNCIERSPETSPSNICKSQWERLRIELRLRDYEPHVRPLHYPPSKCLGLVQDPGGPVRGGASGPRFKPQATGCKMTKMDKNLPRICPGKIAVFRVSVYLYGAGAKSGKTMTRGSELRFLLTVQYWCTFSGGGGHPGRFFLGMR